jgi:hypothetical protein
MVTTACTDPGDVVLGSEVEFFETGVYSERICNTLFIRFWAVAATHEP